MEGLHPFLLEFFWVRYFFKNFENTKSAMSYSYCKKSPTNVGQNVSANPWSKRVLVINKNSIITPHVFVANQLYVSERGSSLNCYLQKVLRRNYIWDCIGYNILQFFDVFRPFCNVPTYVSVISWAVVKFYGSRSRVGSRMAVWYIILHHWIRIETCFPTI